MEVQTTVVLSDRERDFVFWLAHGLKPTRAASAAGYAISTSRQLLARPHIRAAIEAVAANTTSLLAKLEAKHAPASQSASPATVRKAS